MWTCQTCGRSFQHALQDHACGLAPADIDAYIAVQPETIQPTLHAMRDVLKKTLPDAQERISWRMPTFWKGKNIVHFAAFKAHIGLYPGAAAIAHFADRLSDYHTSKGAIRFPISQPIPLTLIAEIAGWCYAAIEKE